MAPVTVTKQNVRGANRDGVEHAGQPRASVACRSPAARRPAEGWSGRSRSASRRRLPRPGRVRKVGIGNRPRGPTDPRTFMQHATKVAASPGARGPDHFVFSSGLWSDFEKASSANSFRAALQDRFWSLSNHFARRVMAGLVPAIHALLADARQEDVDARDKRGHDGGKVIRSYWDALYIPRYRCWTSGAAASSRDAVPVQVTRPRSMT